MHHELPEYVLKQHPKRVYTEVIAKGILMLILLYGVLYLLARTIRYPFDRQVQIAVILFLALLFITEMLLTLNRLRNTSYVIYTDKLEIHGKKLQIIDLADVHDITFSKNIFDRLFHTITVVLSPTIRLAGIEESNQLVFTLQKMIQVRKQEHIPHKLQSSRLAFSSPLRPLKQ